MPSVRRRLPPASALRGGLAAIPVVVLVALVAPAAAQPIPGSPPLAPPLPALRPAPSGTPLPVRRTLLEGSWERNNLPMMISGISLTTLGVIAVGLGLGMMFHGRSECDDEALALAKQASPTVNAGVYGLAYDRCARGSAFVNGGIAAVVGGSLFTGIGIPFTIAGAWRLRVEPPREPGAALRIGPGSLAVEGRF